MTCSSLQELLALLQKTNQLYVVKDKVSPHLELSCITSETSRAGGPALLFENTGGPFPVLANAFGSLNRICMALGIEDLEKGASRTEEILLKQGGTSCEQRASSGSVATLSKAPCHEVVLVGEEVDLSMLPIPRCWPADAGPAITLPVVFTSSPETEMPNAGLYRMQVVGKNSTLMHWYPGSGGAVHYQEAMKNGKSLPVAVAIGPDPAVTLAACAPVPERVYEVDFASCLTGRSIEMVRCITSDLLVPASSQIVLEGECPGDFGVEGPFGTHTGYYSEAGKFPLFKVKCMTMRRDAILPVTVPGPPPQEDCFMAKALERLFLPLLRERISDITDINFPLEGIFARLVFVAIRKRYPGHAADVIQMLWNSGKGMFSRMIWVFDHDTDIHDISEVLWKMANRTNFHRDIILAPGPTDSLDPHAALCNGACRMGLDCTEKWKEERDGVPHPEKMEMPLEVMERCSDIVSKILTVARHDT